MRLDFIDYPTAWAIQHSVGDSLTHHPDCSSRPQWRLLCDCGAIVAEWERRRQIIANPACADD